MKTLKAFAITTLIALTFAACDPKRNNATLGSGNDSLNSGAKPDTSNSAQDSSRKDSSSKGNVNPTGHATPQH
ncbi:hypothetical protein DYU05_17980 [Mucilaginibacter terrenus]|uniref:Coproporphyrinogen III oxidase n=1 Tax=Mucilaginibacter terrenus TaxID=2482727 RepID=A0A3E2NL99_9SPHI|nr:hypothetical protein [Mucilaginibacter terrenus]RFZ81713.1 hypothetical protein DYU05_17980 [Mucilaginibacter terrenus]